MADPRLAKLARVMLRYSLPLKPGDLIQINSTMIAAPLLRELYREALELGAIPLVRMVLEDAEELLYKYGSDEQIRTIPEVQRLEFEQVQARLSIFASENTRALTNIDPKKIAMRRQAVRPLTERFFQRVAEGQADWSLTLYPTQAAAQDAEMSLSDYEDFVYTAGRLDADDPIAEWKKVSAEQQKIADFLGTVRHVHLLGPDIDLHYDTGGRSWINADGRKNFPDGEVFTSPDETKTEGFIRYSFPAIYAGREVTDIRLTFENGLVTKATASKGEDLLHSLLNMDEGARRLGEAAFGTNYQITRFSRNILFDEKIGGTIHLAVGSSFPEIGGQNRSALHWDMITDMNHGEAYGDGKLFYKDGKFVL